MWPNAGMIVSHSCKRTKTPFSSCVAFFWQWQQDLIEFLSEISIVQFLMCHRAGEREARGIVGVKVFHSHLYTNSALKGGKEGNEMYYKIGCVPEKWFLMNSHLTPPSLIYPVTLTYDSYLKYWSTNILDPQISYQSFINVLSKIREQL